MLFQVIEGIVFIKYESYFKIYKEPTLYINSKTSLKQILRYLSLPKKLDNFYGLKIFGKKKVNPKDAYKIYGKMDLMFGVPSILK